MDTQIKHLQQTNNFRMKNTKLVYMTEKIFLKGPKLHTDLLYCI